ncbi:MAG: hypothetical protein IT371_11360 [Deltaproteobacteria bacterium]|nr:hypothetical protein [Deltaproteobacteria bacterium]
MHTPPDPAFSPRRRLAVLLAALVLTALSYARSLEGTFIWDDVALVVQNRYIKNTRYIGRNLSSTFWDVGMVSTDLDTRSKTNIYYRPLVTLTYMADYWLYGLKPWGYHLTNLLAHLVAVGLAFLLVRRLFPADPLAATAALLVFALHPSRSEAVTWISGRTDVLMAIFFIPAVVLYWDSLAAERGRGVRLALAWLFYAAAVLCKETAISLALMVPLLDLLLVSRGERARFWRNAKQVHLPLVAITLVYVVLRLLLQRKLVGPQDPSPLGHWAMTVLETVGRYALLVVNPYQPSVQHAAYATARTPSWPILALGGAILVGGAAAIWLARRRYPKVAWALVVAGAALAPVSNVIPLRLNVLVADRFLYLPLLGVGLLVGAGLALASRRLRPLLFGVLVLVVATWGVTAHVRAGDYTDNLRFWQATAESSPGNPVAEESLAAALVNKGRYREAERWLAMAFQNWTRYEPKEGRPLEMLLRLVDLRMRGSGGLDRAFLEEVVAFTGRLIHLAKDTKDPARRVTLRIGKVTMVVMVDSPMVHERLTKAWVDLHALRGSALSWLGRDAEALAALKEALRRSPDALATNITMAIAHARALELEAAQRLARRARDLEPDAEATSSLLGALDQAVPRIQALRRLGYHGTATPASDPQVHRLLGELYVLLRAPLRVRGHLERLIALDPNDRAARAMLALELAAGGDLVGALRVVRDARTRFGNEGGLEQLERQVRQSYDARKR